jgi:glycosyltransferase involved in cell wall biosynthesis
MRIALYTPLSKDTLQESMLDWRWYLAWREALIAISAEIEDAIEFSTLSAGVHKYQQDRMRSMALSHADRLANLWLARLRDKRPQLWITLQPYHQAPDWVGMHVCQQLQIPYVVVNPTVVPEEVTGFWRDGYQQTLVAIAKANKVLTQSAENFETLKKLIPPVDQGDRLLGIKPFINPEPYLAARYRNHASRYQLAKKFGMDPQKIWLLSVVPFQTGLVLDGVKLLSEGLSMIRDPVWQLLVLGSGSQGDLVREALAPLPSESIFCYNLPSDAPHHVYFGAADLFVWPGINPGQNYALLEALAAGLPTVTAKTRFNREVIAPNKTGLIVKDKDPWAVAEGVSRLIGNPSLRQQFSEASIAKVRSDHNYRHVLPMLERLFQRLGRESEIVDQSIVD